MVKAVALESLCIVDFAVETNDSRDIVEAKVREVRLGCVQRVPVVDLGLCVRASERKKFVRDQPVEVTVLDSFVVFVLLAVKVVKVKET